VLRPEDSGAVWGEPGGWVRLKDSLRALVELKGTMDTTTMNRYNDYHLFLYGTNYTSKVENGTFSFRGVPEGKYNAYLITLPRKEHQGSGADSTDIFSTTDPLSTSTTNLSRSEPYDRVRLPDSLITP
jgi:hypothetical protein